ncbi:MAG TPA: hypothetical protein VIH57_21890 [Bacteroidales bacterium]
MNDIIKKLKFKAVGAVINAPAGLEKEFTKLGFSSSLDNHLKNENTLLFVNNNKEFVDFLDNQLKKIETDSVLWIAYPKGSSKIKTDINRDTLRVTAEKYGITTVTAISVDNTWSALRFRPIDRVGK